MYKIGDKVRIKCISCYNNKIGTIKYYDYTISCQGKKFVIYQLKEFVNMFFSEDILEFVSK